MTTQFKVGDRVRLTPSRFRQFMGGQGVIDPNRIYTVERTTERFIYLTEILNQAHNAEHLKKIVKPTIVVHLKQERTKRNG